MARSEEQILADLARHPGWSLVNEMDIRERDGHFVKEAKRLFSMKPTDEIDQMELAYWRGYYRGRRALINTVSLYGRAKEADSA